MTKPAEMTRTVSRHHDTMQEVIIGMCIAVPGQVVSINPLNMATVDFGGTTRAASADLVPEVAVGDYVLVHAGFIINRLDDAEAQETLKLFRQYMDLTDHDEVP